MKAKNLKRDPRASLCVISDGFFGEWVQVDGTATVVSLPDALEGLVDYYRKVAGEHPDWDDYRNAIGASSACSSASSWSAPAPPSPADRTGRRAVTRRGWSRSWRRRRRGYG